MNNIFDVNDNSFYNSFAPKQRTKDRLIQIKEIGMKLVGYGQFGIDGVMSGLYIEMLWNMPNDEWDDYLSWVKSLLNQNSKK